jgi:trk system potassium uptake protein TrkH
MSLPPSHHPDATIRVPRWAPTPLRLRLKRARRSLQLRPTRRPVLLVLGFAVLILAGTALLLLPISARNGAPAPLAALFTATSAVCVTGLVVVDTHDYWTPFGQTVIAILMQFGGLGFVIGVATIRLLLGQRPSLRDRLLLQETGAITLLGGQQALIVRAVAITFGAEALGALLLWTRFAPQYGPWQGLWYALFHAIAAFTNGSFDLFGGFRSVAPFRADPLVLLTLAGLIIVGGLSVVTLTDLWQHRPWRSHRGGWRRLSVDSKAVLFGTALLLGGGTALLLITEWGNPATLAGVSPWQRLLDAFFHATAARTAGFAAWDLSQARQSTLFMLCGLMFIGGAPGSMAGGIKITTLAALLAAIWGSLRGQSEPTLFARRIPPRLIGQALAVTALALALVVNVALLISVREGERLGASFTAILYEVTSAFGTVGSSTGLPPRFGAFSQCCLIAMMFIGRLGPVTVALILTERGREERHRYPSESLRIG